MTGSPAQHIEAMRQLLSLPDRDEQLWIDLTLPERATLLRAAGLPVEWSQRLWPLLGRANQQLIISEIKQLSSWALRLQAVRCE